MGRHSRKSHSSHKSDRSDDRHKRDKRDKYEDRGRREDSDKHDKREKRDDRDRRDKYRDDKRDKRDDRDKRDKREDRDKRDKHEDRDKRNKHEDRDKRDKNKDRDKREKQEDNNDKQEEDANDDEKRDKLLKLREKIRQRKGQATSSEHQDPPSSTEMKTEDLGPRGHPSLEIRLLKKAKTEEPKPTLFSAADDSDKPHLTKLDLETDSDKLHLTRPELEADLHSSPEPTENDHQTNEAGGEGDEEDPLDAFMNMNNKALEEEKHEPRAAPSRPRNEDSESEEELEEEEGEDETNFAAFLKKKWKIKQIPTAEFSTAPFNKKFYRETPEISRMTNEEVELFKARMGGIQIVGKKCPRPVKHFAQMGLSERILKLLEKHSFKYPTPVQAQAVPAIMSGRDVIGCAQTGSGKTLAFLLPLLRHVMDQPPLSPGDGPIALVIAPTRELVTQIHKEFRKFTRGLELSCVAVYGGVGVASQIGELKRGAEIVICTPGRMIDVLCTNAGRVTNLKRVTFVVLDEADRMFDLGFEPQITRILQNIRPDRQMILFSATFPKKVEMLARKGQKKPLEIIVGKRSTVCSDVDQHVEIVLPEHKWKRLLELLKAHANSGGVIIFLETQQHSDKLAQELTSAGYPTQSLHSGLNQEERDFTVDDFKRGVCTILTATAIASRGLDVDDLNLVINFDVPNHLEDYVHKVGRTGRAGNKGTSYTFITPDEERFAPAIATALAESGAKIPEELEKMVSEFKGKIERGENVQIASSGFSGKGFQFNEEEARKKEEERKKEKIAHGIEDVLDEEDDDEALFSDDEEVPAQLRDPASAATDKKTKATKELIIPSANGDKSKSSISIEQIVSNIFDDKKSNMPKFTNAQSKEQISNAVQKMLQNFQHQAEERKRTQHQQQQNPEKTIKFNSNNNAYTDEIEINDFPQSARWRVTHRESMAALQEFTDVTIIAKGVYIPPGTPVPSGERKIYLYLEASSQQSLMMAKREIFNILKEESERMETPKGKYKI